MKYLKDKKHVYFIAIGGIGMSAIAFMLLKRGYRISGADLNPNHLTGELARMGAKVYQSHREENISDDVDLVVYSSCIRRDNPEMAASKKRRIQTASRGTILAELVQERKGIAVCGCHGKTTTSGMIATMLTDAGFDPAVLVGGEVNFLGSNARYGIGEYLVTEADESDGSFLELEPYYSVITNIDEDHMEYFKTSQSLIRRFGEYVANIKKGGCFVYCADDSRVVSLKKYCRQGSIGFGIKDADVYARNIRLSDCRTEFDCFYKKGLLGNFRLAIPGGHNVLNALAAVCIGVKLGLSAKEIRSGLARYSGAKRRFQIHGCFSGVTVVEDYAHHPTEIMATLKAAKAFKPRRIIGVFQPHRFTRTLYLADRFSNCFDSSDYLILTDIYSASEDNIKNVSGKLLYNKVIRAGHKHVIYIEKDKITEHLCKIKKPGDMVIVLGAGDINKVATEFAEKLK